MPRQVFVYGTLLRGEVNHHLLEGAIFRGEWTTPARYRMFHLGHYPGVVEGGTTAIQGEVYRVDARQFAALDRLEDYPRLYTRRLIPTAWGRAWVYLYRGALESRPSIPSGAWRGQPRPSGRFRL